MLLWFQSLFLGSRFQRSQSIVRMCGDLCSVFEYSDCVKECQVRNVARDQYSFKNNGFQLLQIPEIRSWFDEILAGDKPFDMYSRHSVEIFQLCVAHLRSKLDMESSFDNSSKDMVETEDEECATVGDSTQAIQPSIQFSNGSRWSLKSLIYRKPGKSRNYGSTVHRDMDERAVKNAPDSTMFINIWIPLCTIYHDPLAILLPETVSDEDISGFKGLEYDRTGLKASDDHSWVYFDTMSLGDVLVWRTQDIYHAAFHIGEESQRYQRESVDIRIWIN